MFEWDITRNVYIPISILLAEKYSEKKNSAKMIPELKRIRLQLNTYKDWDDRMF